MARIRSIKPEFFKNEELARLTPLARLLFAGLWCWADRAGRLEDRPARLKAEILPYDDCDCESMLSELAGTPDPFIARYEVDGRRYIEVLNFLKHQFPHHRESESLIPAPGENGTSPRLALGQPRESLNSARPSPSVLGNGSLVLELNERMRDALDLRREDWEDNAKEACSVAKDAASKLWGCAELKPVDRSLLAKVALLAVMEPTQPYCRDWLNLALAAGENKKRSPGGLKNPGGYLSKCLGNEAEKAGRDWRTDLAGLESVIPAEVINPRRQAK